MNPTQVGDGDEGGEVSGKEKMEGVRSQNTFSENKIFSFFYY